MTQYFYFRLPAGAATEPALGMDPDAQPRAVEEALGRGAVGSLLFVTDPADTNRLQRLALAGNRHGIPALFGFDVIPDSARSSRYRSRWQRPGVWRRSNRARPWPRGRPARWASIGGEWLPQSSTGT